ncbi:meiotic nuclear division protein 1 homolog [Rhipicephalus sanguineus]|uniref:meiotic nuclear division protein 1 homolog n=1 Tax=Rhipicephalus sanguineus TaxID=34632 RepID=UPI001894CB69|nr:meiotic nuclear division protein 1 homolog [Rhipicephalus sanguineus]
MSKRKGVSAEEKRQRMLQVFYEKKDVFQLKDLEKIGPKEKGVIAQAVKDVVQSLVDDGLVDSEKIGTSVYFWSFPSKAVSTRKRKIDQLKTKVEDVQKKLKFVESQLAKAQVGREDSSEREELMSKLSELERDRDEVSAELDKHRDCDPEVLEEVKKQTLVAKEATNRWTDNIFSIKSWVKNKFFIEESVLNKQFGIPEELDYV